MSTTNQEVQKLLEQLKQADSKLIAEKSKKQLVANQLVNLVVELPPHERSMALQEMVDLMSGDEMTERLTRLLSQNQVPLANIASFRQLLVQATRRRQLISFQPLEWLLNNKRAAYQFVDSLKVKRPEIYAFNESLDTISLRKGSVLKPENGSSSHGVFVLDQKGGAFEVRTGEKLSSLHELRTKAKGLLKAGVIKADTWLLEEFIGDFEEGSPLPVVDLKFYCFYGEVGVVYEIERADKTRYCEWLPDGTPTETGIYKEGKFLGQGFTPEQLSIAKSISKQIAAPFLRIDFVKSKTHFSFGEFTPRPGHFTDFNSTFDRRLGELYLQAEARLYKQLAEK